MSEYGSAITIAQAKEGETLYAYLTGRGLSPSPCAGRGICGNCRVRYRDCAPPPAQTERRVFGAQELRLGYRLACLHPAAEGSRVEICFETDRETAVVDAFVSPKAVCVKPGAKKARAAVSGSAAVSATVLAADLGTTTLALQLREKRSGAVLGAYRQFNPQRAFGADVVSRMRAAMSGRAEELREAVRDGLETGVLALQKEAAEKGLPAPELLALAGNTVMCHLLMGWDMAPLAAYPFRPFCLEEAQTELAGVKTLLLPGISAFAGADLLAGVLALDLDRPAPHCAARQASAELSGFAGQEGKAPEGTALLVDLGTNGELALVCDGKCYCTATAAGPAFEGGTNAGVPGSDMTRLIASLLKEGFIDARGLLREPYFSEGICLEGVCLRQADIRAFQLAKAAVRAGMELLFQKAGITVSEVKQVFLAGGFGYFLDVESAFTVGLFPEELRGGVTAVGNTSLQGAWLYAQDPAGMRRRALELKARTEVCNLAEQAEFKEEYLGHMNFR